MGTVWEAHHLSLGTEIAIKFLDPEMSNRAEIRSRFAQEATAAARIKSPHVVGITDYGFTEAGSAFIAMELLRGEDLGERLHRESGLTPSETVQIVTQACRGLSKAHAMGVIHRDLKPENLFLVDDDDDLLVKVLDFGIAKAVGPGGTTHKTETGQLLGTPLYMSPEQALGRPVDARSDLYSLTVVAYRCLAGRLPFVYDAVGELIVAVSTLVPPPPSEFNSNLPPSVDAWFAGMFLKDPNARSCQTARALGESFALACEGVVGTPAGFWARRTSTPANADTPTVPADADGEQAPPREVHATGPGVTAAIEQTLRAAEPGEPESHGARVSAHPRRRLVALGGALLLFGVLAILLAQARAPAEGARSPVGPVQPLPASGSAGTPAVISVRFAATPSAATLHLDGQALGSNPYSASRPLDAAPHRLRAEAPGYEPDERSFVMDRDVHLELALKPSPEPAAVTSARVAPAGTPAVRARPGARSTVASGPSSPPPPAPTTPPDPPAPASAKKPGFNLDRTNPWQNP